jgi:RHS repeat-associated protein
VIKADGLGYGSASGPGKGQDDPSWWTGGGGGAGYGGQGGYGQDGGASGSVYGDLYQPIDLGSGGGANPFQVVPGGTGGGAIKMVVSDVLQVEGSISACGGHGLVGGSGNALGGGGSGGSIWIEAGSLSGSGAIRACGGYGGTANLKGGGGAGGRIAVYTDTLDPNLIFSVLGGSGYQDGEEGTVYMDNLDPSLSTVTINPATVPTDGSSTGTITVTLLSSVGIPIPGKPVEVALAFGGNAYIDGQLVTLNEFVDIGMSDENGVATAKIRAETVGQRTVKARSEQELIQQQGTVEFVAGPIDPATSTLETDEAQIPADGVSAANLTVTVLDSFGNPISGVDVILSSTGGTLTQPTSPTDLNGEATGALLNGTVEAATVSATTDGVALDAQVVVDFRGADLAAGLSATSEVIPDGILTYTVSIQNLDLLTAQDVTAELELPAEVTYLSDTAATDPVQNGDFLTWDLGALSYGSEITFTVTTRVAVTTPQGSVLTAVLTANTSTTDDNPSNDSAQANTTVAEAHQFEASLIPTSASLNLGGSAQYTIRVRNIGLVGDSYIFLVDGLDPNWVTLSPTSIGLSPGDQGDAILTIAPDSCQAETTLPFTVDVDSGGSGVTQVLQGQVSLIQAPQITLDSPGQNATTGSRSVLFRWRTDPTTTGTLTLYPQGQPGDAQTFNTSEGTSHAVQVDDLTRYVTYEWNVRADSLCGTATSPIRSFTIGSGIIFVNRNPSFDIDRDYNQIVTITVRNDDSLPHTLLATVQNHYEDLIVNFVGSGSVDQTISLAAGGSRTLDLAVHAMDAEVIDYDLVATITADEGEAVPLTDTTTIHLRVLSEFDLTVTELSTDPVTGTKTYQVTNNGRTISDLEIAAVDPGTGEPARVYFQPNIAHARIKTSQSLTFKMIPLFDERDATVAYYNGGSGMMASLLAPQAAEIPADLIVSGSGQQQTVASDMGCPSGNVYAVTLSNACLTVSNGDWYCTNRPEISVPFSMPYFIDPEDVSSVDLHVGFDPMGAGVLPHTTNFSMNGFSLDGLSDMVPSGTYSTKVPVSALNEGAAGPVTQRLGLSSIHTNGGHYVVATDFAMGLGMDSVTSFVCAGTPQEAEQAAIDTYGFEPISESSVCTGVAIPGFSLWSSSNDLCIGSATQGAVVTAGGPINTHTGGMDYSVTDFSIPTSAGPLAFERFYASPAVDAYTDLLGYGWTHSLDTRLIFPDDPQGREGVVLFKVRSANRYEFTIEDDGTFTPFPGVCGTLTKDDGPPVTYTFVDSAQRTYTFDESGKLTSLTDPQGRSHDYTYDAQGRLEKVSDDTGDRYLSLSYDAQGRIASVSDHTSRQVSFTYDLNGDLSASVDALSKSWTYSYDSVHAHLLSKVIDPDGVIVEHTEYDDHGRAVRQYNGEGELVVELFYDGFGVSKVQDALGNQSVHTYGPRNTIERQSDPLGGETGRSYDENFRPTQIVDEDGDATNLTWSEEGTNLTQVVDAEGNQTDLSYDSLNNLTSIVDPRGFLASYTYDGMLLTGSTDALNGTTTYIYTPEGYLESVTDSVGNTTSYAYDAYGQRTSMNDALGNTWLYRYDDLGRLIETEDPLGRVSRSEYDAMGRLVLQIRNYDPARPQNDQGVYNITTEHVYDAAGNQVEVIDTFGRGTQYTYDDAGRLVSTTDPLGNVSTNTYDEAGNLIATTDALSRTTTYAYDALNRLVSTTDPLGNITTTVYNLDGTVKNTTDALGRATNYTYDDLKRVVSTIDPLGNSTSTVYDEAGNVVSTTDAEGRTTTYEYDALGRLVLQTDPLGGETEHFYDAVGNRVQTIDPREHATTYTYDELNRLSSVTDALGNITSYTYDDVGNRVTVTDGNGHTTTYAYDELGRQIAAADPLGNSTSTAYDAIGNVLSRTDANGNTTTFVYDALNRLTSQTDPQGGVTAYTYDAVGNQLIMTDANGHVTTTAYNALNRPITATDPNGSTFTTGYDAVGNVTSRTDALGKVTAFAYDALNRQTAVTDPLGNSTSYTYDAVGNRISLTDAEGVETRYEHDGLNRLKAVVENYDAGSNSNHETNVRTEYTYDAVGNRLTIIDGNGHPTTFSYDDLNRLWRETDALGHTTSYAYDAIGNRTSLTDAMGFITTFVYNAANRLTTIDYPDPDADVTFTYDAAGNRVEMGDGVGTTTWTYDSLYQVTTVNDPSGDTVGYGYDAVGNRASLAYPDGKLVSYTYDPTDRMVEVLDWDNLTTSYSYDAANRLLTTSLPNGVTSTYIYDDAGQVLNITHATATDTLSSFIYTYDNVGNRTRVEEFYLTPGGGPTVLVTVADERGDPMPDLPVYVFDDTTYTGYHETTDENGEASITLPEGNYRFRVDVDGTQFWSGDENHCAIAGCTSVLMTIPDPVLVVVQDTGGAPMEGLPVYVFDDSTYTGEHGTTDANGEVSLRLAEGNNRFRSDLNGTQFWSDEVNHCTVPGCTLANVTVTIPVTITVEDSMGTPQEGFPVYAFSGGSYTGFNGTSDANGQVSLTLPIGDYRFRADSGGTQFWSGETDHCTIPGCLDATVVVTVPLTVTVEDTNGQPKEGLPVYAFDGSTYTDYHGTTDVNGEVELTLPEGSYRFRADFNETQFWSGEANHCAVPGCSNATVVVTLPVTVTVEDTNGAPKEGVPVYVFDGTTYTNFNGTTDINGEVVFTLPQGSYRFRVDHNGTQFWSDEVNHCLIPGCESAIVVVTLPVTVSVEDTDGLPKEGLPVYAFDGSTYTGFNDTTDVNGEVQFTLQQGGYRFRSDQNGTQFWSGDVNHCTLPGCESASVVVTLPVTVTVEDGGGAALEAVPVYVFDGSTYTGYNGTTNVDGQVDFTLLQGSYRFRAGYDGEQYWSGEVNHCTIPGCEAVMIVAGAAAPTTPTPTETPEPSSTPEDTPTPNPTPTDTPEPTNTPEPTPTESAYLGGIGVLAMVRPAPINLPLLDPDAVTVAVEDTNGNPKEGLPVYVFDGTSYTGYNDISNASGEVVFDLPEGAYRFRSDLNSTQFWSGETNHCDIPGCSNATVVVTIPVTVTVEDTVGTPKDGLPVYAFDGTTYPGYSGTTDVNGEVVLTLPHGDYRFRSDLNGTHFWSGEANHCTIPGCGSATVVVSLPVTVTVTNTDTVPQEGLPVYVFDEATYTGFNGTTDVNGEVSLTLPQGDYRFRSDLNGTQFWSDEINHCTIPDCLNASITVTIPMTVTVQSQTGSPYPDLPVYVFDSETYTGFNGTSDANGQVVFTLPLGDYRFRTDFDGVQFWSGEVTHCTIPGCLEALVEIPGGLAGVFVTIDYTYDPLYRLTGADYSTGEFFHYTYDAVGNRMTQETHEETNTYVFDTANRLIEVDGASFLWDDNGNLIQDDVRIYGYDHANRLALVLMEGDTYNFTYNGLGARLRQTVNGSPTSYTLDLQSGLTQVLADGTNVHLYGRGRSSKNQSDEWDYYLVDVLGSIRQLSSADGSVTLARGYDPFGSRISSIGSINSSYGFTGEWMDGTGLSYLRARYYDPYLNQWIQPDPIVPNPYRPWEWNKYTYVRNNPVNLTDPSGLSPLIPPEPPNHRDLTYWLYNELHTNANSYYTQRIKSLLSSPFPINKERAIAGWVFLVKDKAKWDFKHKIEDELLGQTILLRHDTGYRWYEYSIPGNIHFGYVGRAAGFSGLALHLGAGYAEVTDPAHSDRGEACCPQVCRVGVAKNIPYALCVRLGCYYFNPDWALTLFDDPKDWQNVEFGVKLYDTYRENLTFDQFQSFLASHGNQLTPAAVIPEWNWVNPGGWPYNLGRFDGPDTGQNQKWVDLLLGAHGE